MKKLFNDGWEFSKQKPGSGIADLGTYHFERVNLPHDWLIYQANDLYEDSTGFYRKRFSIEKKAGMHYEIYFEGAYMDTSVYLNGTKVGAWKYGYTSFFFDLTEYITDGENTLVVMCEFLAPNSRWYSGAGIYRDVYFLERPERHFVTDSLYVSAKPDGSEPGVWQLFVSAEVAGETGSVTLDVPKLGIMGTSDVKNGMVCFEETVRHPALWSNEHPSLYDLTLRLDSGDEVSARFGFRQLEFDVDQGLFVNGTHVKLNGVCEHHDLGALGAAYNGCAMRRKLELLREMGVNAIRCAHNPPAPDVLDLCDEMGFFVLNEIFDMWESKKTDYDYARFFGEWQERDVASWVRRDRSHPCVILWSIGNEIYDTHRDERGRELALMLAEETRSHDPKENARVCLCSNYMAWEGTQKCAEDLKFAGYNYGENLYDEHHAHHPDWHIFGSETGSIVQSRGIYHFPLSQKSLADDDMQCSSLGNAATSWGAPNPEYCILAERDRAFSLGQFLWTGFDYLGEPTPYHSRNSFFGQMDTAGFPKDTCFIFRSAWTDCENKPFVHVFPYWDFNIGQRIDVRIASNAPQVELFLNQTSCGRKKLERDTGSVLCADYSLEYVPGEITAVAYDESGNELCRESRHSFGDSRALRAHVYGDRKELKAGCGDMAFIEISTVDQDGYPVENAVDAVCVEVTGAGYLAGLDNGDSTDMDAYKGCKKRLFSGKLLAHIAAGQEPGEIRVAITSSGLEPAEVRLKVCAGSELPGISLLPERLSAELYEERPHVRRIALSCDGDRTLDKENAQRLISAVVYPQDAAKHITPDDMIWKVVNEAGIESGIASVERLDGYQIRLHALADGDFKVRCMIRQGGYGASVFSDLEFHVSEMGQAYLNPYDYIRGGLAACIEGETGMGNDHGVATMRGGKTVVSFDNIDFGAYGSDEITIDLFVLGDHAFLFQLWEGVPEAAGSEMLFDGMYQKKMIWNQYQAQSYRLNRRVWGITSLCMVTYDKAHIGGFSFARKEKAYALLTGGDCDNVYGDSFELNADRIDHIGNNVTVEYRDMDFGETGARGVEIHGVSHISHNTIHLRLERAEGVHTDILEFEGEGEQTRLFEIDGFKGKGTLQLVFLPGSSFDLLSLQFTR